jgi:hypothetical protein
MGYIEELKETIVRLHGCKAEYFTTVPVTEIFQDKIVWQGDVEVFNLRWHPKAKRCWTKPLRGSMAFRS